MARQSIVDYMGEQNGHNCGYCGQSNSSISHGMWAYSLTAQDYQDLIDRGWRRSGQYCYKPKMKSTCCPSYTIRCEALNFKMTKSQKKTAKAIRNFLAFDKKSSLSKQVMGEQISDAHQMPQGKEFNAVMEVDSSSMTEQPCDVESCPVNYGDSMEYESKEGNAGKSNVEDKASVANVTGEKITSTGYDPSRGPCRKAKDIRRERRVKKLLASGMSPEEISSHSSPKCLEKSLEEFLNEPLPENAPHKLELRLVPCRIGTPQFDATFDESYGVYKKYQMAVHKDTPDECTEEQYKRFLVKTPYFSGDTTAPLTYAPFHHQYVLDGKIIAVGVLDILPYCISSVYFYYDPDYSFLSLGRYSALTEIALTRKLSKKFPLLKYYYMGFYIHSCPKMTYKANYFPSYLLCPETCIFQPIEKCKPKLDVEKYQRLEEDPEKQDVDGVLCLKEVRVFFGHQHMNYPKYKRLVKHSHEEALLAEYGVLVGKKCYNRMSVYMT